MSADLQVRNLFGNLPELVTPRLVLRKLTMEDAEDGFAYAREPEVVRYMTWEVHRTIEDTRKYLRDTLERYAAQQPASWAIVLKESGRMIGNGGFPRWAPEHARGELGYVLARRCWGRGLATEAAQAMLACGFRQMNFHRIYANCDPCNVASRRVLEKLGMKFEGIARQDTLARGQFHDSCMYAILREEFEAQAGVK